MRPAAAENIAVGNYGNSANGMPYAVALAKGYFKEEGANVTGIISSQGGGTSVRNAMAGVAYGEANPDLMQDIADATGGKHYIAPDAAALQDIFEEIALTLPVMFTD